MIATVDADKLPSSKTNYRLLQQLARITSIKMRFSVQHYMHLQQILPRRLQQPLSHQLVVTRVSLTSLWVKLYQLISPLRQQPFPAHHRIVIFPSQPVFARWLQLVTRLVWLSWTGPLLHVEALVCSEINRTTRLSKKSALLWFFD